MKTPVEQVVEEIESQNPNYLIRPAVDKIVAKLKEECRGMTLEEIQVWMDEQQKQAVTNFLREVASTKLLMDKTV